MANRVTPTFKGSNFNKNQSGKFKPQKLKLGPQKKRVFKKGERDLKRDGAHIMPSHPSGGHGVKFGKTMMNGNWGNGKTTRIITVR